MANLYVQTTGASTNSGSTDTDAATLSGSDATWSGTTTVTLDGSPDLSGLATSGATQAAIYLSNASNANKKIFWISAVDNDAKTVTVDTAPTGTSGSAWAIGGRQTVVQTCADVLRAGDTLTINDTPAATSGIHLTTRVSGARATLITVQGASGTPPVLSSTANHTISVEGHDFWTFKNLDIRNSSATATHYPVNIATSSDVTVLTDCIVSASGGNNALIYTAGFYTFINGGDFSGVSKYAAIYIDAATPSTVIQGARIHDITDGSTSGDGVWNNNGSAIITVANTLIERCVGRGLYAATTGAGFVVLSSTIYRCDKSGVEIAGATGSLQLWNSILLDNGDAGTEYNIKIDTAAVLWGRYNCISVAGSRGGGNVSGYTLDATDITDDPLFVDPDNATAASRNFGLQDGSPCKATGFPGAFEGSTGTTGYLDMGAVQREEPGVSVKFTLYTALSGTREETFEPGDTVQVTLTVTTSAALTSPTTLVEVRNQSDDSVVATLHNSTSNLSSGANSIADLTWTAVAGNYYVRVTVTDTELEQSPTTAETQFTVAAAAASVVPFQYRIGRKA